MIAVKDAASNVVCEGALNGRVHAQAQRVFEQIVYPAIIGLWLVTVMTAVLVFLVEPTKQTTAAYWVAVHTAVMLANFLVWEWAQIKALSPKQKDLFYAAMAMPHGLIWIVAVFLFFDPQQTTVSMFLVCMLAGASAGAVSAMASMPHLYWVVMVPAFAAQSVIYATRGSGTFHTLIALATTVLLIANLIFLKVANRTLKQSIRLAFENVDLIAQLREQTTTALDANNAKTKFLAAASHDLRQPVHALMLFLEVLGNTQLDERQRTLIGHIRSASQASAELLTTLLDFSRIEAGVMQPKPQAVALAPLLRELEDEFGPQADSKQLVYRTRDTHAVAYCDKSLVALVLRNFVSNAVRYTHSGGVLIGVRAVGNTWRLMVCDTGIGIASHHREEIFKEFHQLGNDERDRQKGLGLGLSIAKGLAASMGAQITLESVPGRGSTFSLWLPQAQFAPSQKARQPPQNVERAQIVQPPTTTRDLHGLQVLVVDDDQAVRLSVTLLLQSWGCHVRSAEGLDDALALAIDQPPQLLVTDYRLRNERTGGDVITQLRKQCGSALPAIIITGDTDPARLRETATHRATLLHKPVSAEALRAALITAESA